MAREVHKKVLGKHEYETHQLGALQGRKVLMRVFSALKKGDVHAWDESDLEYFCDVFGPVSSVKIGQGSPTVTSVFDAHFSDNYFEMTQWLSWCIEVKFG